jgi:Fe-S cluster assembly protein SufD
MAGLQGAVEAGAPVSRLHEQQSYDPADFPVPTGREEEWRFTPLRRLRGLHSDASLGGGKVTVEADAGPGVTVEAAQHGDPRVGTAFVPADRVSARAFASFGEATVVSVREGAESTAPTWISVRGEDSGEAAAGHLVVNVEPNARAVVVLGYSGSATYADNVELVVGDGGSLTIVSLQDWADDAVHLSHHHALLGKDARLTHTAGPGETRTCGDCISPTPGSTWSTGCSLITPSATAAAGSATRARCRARTRTRCGSVTWSSEPRRPAPTPTSTTGTWC